MISNGYIDRNSIESPLKRTRHNLNFEGNGGFDIKSNGGESKKLVSLSYNKAQVANQVF